MDINTGQVIIHAFNIVGFLLVGGAAVYGVAYAAERVGNWIKEGQKEISGSLGDGANKLGTQKVPNNKISPD